ncbi:MAG TPA: dTMP kinase [Symbiobacteriaceae bacterium]|nr:dTMP kinase [Symbiobacteriaceae bacterium]
MAVFISFEGLDGAGKGTQLPLLLDYLQEKGVDYVFTREPGGTPLAERIRELLLDPGYTGMSVISEALLFAAGRADHVSQVIRPALQAGKVVICDRYVDASMVYQGVAGGLPLEFVAMINEMATGALKPHRTIVLDLPTDVAMQRRRETGLDRIEQKDVEYHRLVREGYLDLAHADSRRVKVVDASGTVDQVQAQIRKLVDEILPRRTAK